MYAGKKKTITVKTKNGSVKSSNGKVVKVKKKKVGTNKYKYTLTAKSAGTATVTYKKGGKTVKVNVKVKKPTVSITATTYDSYVKIKWKTKGITEDTFLIYRSTDGKKWERLSADYCSASGKKISRANFVYTKPESCFFKDSVVAETDSAGAYYYKAVVYYGKDGDKELESDVAKTHGHTWEAVYETVHHDAETHYEYEYEWHVVDAKGTDWGTSDEASEARKQVALAGGVLYSYHTEHVVVDSWLVVDEEAYDEEVVSYYECSCGATKDAD